MTPGSEKRAPKTAPPATLIEQVWYRLDNIGTNDELLHQIARAVVRLPADVREFVLDLCVFAPFSQTSVGQRHRLAGDFNGYLVLIAEDQTDENTQAAVAHEVAHAWLEHLDLHTEAGTDWKADEHQVTALARTWGFSAGKLLV